MYLFIAATIPRANTQGNAAGVCVTADKKRSLCLNQEVVSQQQRQHPSGHAAVHSDSKPIFPSPSVKLLHRGDGPVGHQYHGSRQGAESSSSNTHGQKELLQDNKTPPPRRRMQARRRKHRLLLRMEYVLRSTE